MHRRPGHQVVIQASQLRSIAKARLRDADVLLRAKRFDGAFYLCGYAVELALKSRICRTLGWSSFPETKSEFEGLQSIKTHDLERLLRFSGIEERIRRKYLSEWSEVVNWNPEKRYQAIGQSTPQQATDMLTSAKRLLAVI
jgi:HEPN domain-containing protein